MSREVACPCAQVPELRKDLEALCYCVDFQNVQVQRAKLVSWSRKVIIRRSCQGLAELRPPPILEE